MQSSSMHTRSKTNNQAFLKIIFKITNTFDSLAKQVGFSSYNPFFTAFKDIVGKPPQEYCANLEPKL